jgi:hypothetical protein
MEEWNENKANINILDEIKSRLGLLREIKANMVFKIRILLILMDVDYKIMWFRKKCLIYFYQYIIKPIFKVDFELFYKLYKENTVLLERYYTIYWNNIYMLMDLVWQLNFFEFIKLFIKWIFIIITMPFRFIINHQKWKYITNYKQGIQGFRDNPMHMIINRPRKKKDWKVKLHFLLMHNIISLRLQDIRWRRDSLLEIFLMYKVEEVKWTNKNTFQDYFWKSLYWNMKTMKETILDFMITYMEEIEDGYKSFETTVENKNFSYWDRVLYSYRMYKLLKNSESFKEQKRISRDLIFFKKARDRRKLMRTYFIKGMINWLTYITINKVIFTKVENNFRHKRLRHKGLRHRHIKYKSIKLDKTLHLPYYITYTPPQFWGLVILYDAYFRYIVRYHYDDYTYPMDWDEDIQYDKRYKWRLSTPEHIYGIPFVDRWKIAIDVNNFKYDSFVNNLAKAPFDPMLRWILFLLEFGFSFEHIMSDGKEIWGDISVTHLLTYNEYLNAYEYEIKDYNRLIKGYSFFRIAENSFDKDSKEHYDERFAMVSKNLAMKNKNILQSVLERRRLKSAEILHKALLRNVAMTPQERDAEMEELKEKDYFYSKKREFFDEMGIEHYMDWKAQYDSKIIEDKYFNTFNMDDITDAARREEAYFNKFGIVNPVMRYMLNTIVLKSYDQTLEDISYFLKFKAWKILEKKKCKKVINYKHLYIKPSFLKRISYFDSKDVYETIIKKKKKVKKAILKEREEGEEGEEGEEVEEVEEVEEEVEEKVKVLKYTYADLGPLEWALTKTEPLYGFVENNYFSLYSETGTLYTYQEKVEYNEGAKNYNRIDPLFHGNETLLEFSKIIHERHIGLKDLRKITVRKGRRWNTKHIVTLAYVNNIRWSWEQWLGYGDTRTEDEILQNNTILLNERYSIWNLKRCPIRVKLPIVLGVSEVAALDFFKERQNYISMYDHYFYLLGAIGVGPLVRDSVRWWQAKLELERVFQKNITDLIFWVFRASVFDAEINKIKEDHSYVLRNFIRNFQTYNKLYFIGMQYYTWDLIRYNDIWVGVDEFPFHRYWKLKQMEFLAHDPAAAKIVEKVHNLGYSRYKPGNYIFFFKNQFSATYFYQIYGLFAVGNFLWVLKVLFYHPGEYLAAPYMLITPLYLWMTFWYLRRRLAPGKDVSEGSQLYLYKFHKSKSYFDFEWDQMIYAERQRLIEKDNFFMDDEKKMKMYGTLIPQVKVEKEENWWRNYTHLDKDDMHYNYKHIRYLLFIMSVHILAEYWYTQKFRFRNYKIFWDFYRLDEQMFLLISESGDYAPKHWHERQWYMDSFWRLETGGNLFSNWYENFYRHRQGRKLVDLDYGYDWQKIKNLDVTMFYDPTTIVHIPTSYSDASWVDLCRRLRIYIPDELKAGGGVFTKDGTWKYAVKKKRLKWREFSERGLTEEEIVRKRTYELYGDDGMNTFQHIYFTIKKIFKEILIEQYLGIKYTQNYNPLQHWFDFQKLILDFYNYDLTGEDYMSFIFESRHKTLELIKKDFARYSIQNDNNIIEYIQPLLQKKEIFLIKKNCFEKGTDLDLKTLLSVSENEKHLSVLYNNFFQYKLKRLDLLLKSDNWQLMDVSKNVKNVQVFENNEKVQEVLNSKLEIELYLKKCEQYMIKLFKNISYEDKLDYKCNLLLNLWNEKQWSWWIIKDVYNSSNILEILDILIKFISKII